MAPLHLLVVEDDPRTAEEIRKAMEACGYTVQSSRTIVQAEQQLRSAPPDAVLIDIYLDGKSDGIALAQKMNRGELPARPFIFLTNVADRQTFEAARLTMPYSYLLKPFNALELAYAVELAFEKHYDQPSASLHAGKAIAAETCLFVKKRDTMVKLLPADIESIKVEGRYCALQVKDEQFVVQASLKEMWELLPEDQFVRIHRTHLANLNMIRSISPGDAAIKMESGALLPLSRRYLEQIRKNYRILI